MIHKIVQIITLYKDETSTFQLDELLQPRQDSNLLSSFRTRYMLLKKTTKFLLLIIFQISQVLTTHKDETHIFQLNGLLSILTTKVVKYSLSLVLMIQQIVLESHLWISILLRYTSKCTIFPSHVNGFLSNQ